MPVPLTQALEVFVKNWLRRTLGILALGGGTLGCAAIFTTLFSEQPTSSKVILLVFLPVYIWGAWCGVQMLERHPRAVQANLVFWAIQTPVLQSTAITYVFASGALGGVWIQFSPAKINLLGWLGSRFELSINQQTPLAFGLNLVAAAVCVVLWRVRRDQALSN